MHLCFLKMEEEGFYLIGLLGAGVSLMPFMN